MKKFVIGVLFIIVLAISLCACGGADNSTEHSNDASLNVEAGSIELTIPDDYEYSEDSDESTVIYVAYNSDGEVAKAIIISSLEAIGNIDADLEEIREQAKEYAKKLDATEEGELIKLQTEKKTIIEEGYPLVICTCENANHEYLKDYFYFFEDCTGVIIEINYEKRDFSDIDQAIKDAYFDLEERFSENATEETTATETTEATTEAITEPTSETSNGLGTEVTDSDKKTKVWICAQDVVTQDLKSPSTAKFCKVYEATVYHQTGKQYIAMGYVDSENGFGAMIRTNFTVWLTMTKSGYKDAYAEYDE